MNLLVWNGLWHPIWATSHLLVVVALGLLSIQNNIGRCKNVWLAFLPALILGLSLTLQRFSLSYSDFYLLTLAAVMGLLIAIRPPLRREIPLVLALVAGCLIGLDSAVPRIPGLKNALILASLGATALSVCCILLITQAMGALLQKVWQGLAVRILGAWIAAGSLMVLALLVNQLKQGLN